MPYYLQPSLNVSMAGFLSIRVHCSERLLCHVSKLNTHFKVDVESFQLFFAKLPMERKNISYPLSASKVIICKHFISILVL